MADLVLLQLIISFLIASFVLYYLMKNPILMLRPITFISLTFGLPLIIILLSFYFDNIVKVLYPTTPLLSFIGPLSIQVFSWVRGRIQPLQISSIVFDLTKSETFQKRMLSGLDPLYDERISPEQAEKLLKVVPIEIRNNTDKEIFIRSLFLEIFQPVKRRNSIKYEKKKEPYPLKVKPDLPIEIEPKKGKILELQISDLIIWGKLNVTQIGEVSYSPKMRIGVQYQERISYSPEFYYARLIEFIRIMLKVSARRRMSELVTSYILQKLPPRQLCDAVAELYTSRGQFSLIGYLDLLKFLEKEMPDKTQYIEEVKKRLGLDFACPNK